MADTTIRKVIAGPAGHWYAFYSGELVAVPMAANLDEAPVHPSALSEDEVFRSGWYAPDDLQGEERWGVLDALGAA